MSKHVGVPVCCLSAAVRRRSAGRFAPSLARSSACLKKAVRHAASLRTFAPATTGPLLLPRAPSCSPPSPPSPLGQIDSTSRSRGVSVPPSTQPQGAHCSGDLGCTSAGVAPFPGYSKRHNTLRHVQAPRPWVGTLTVHNAARRRAGHLRGEHAKLGSSAAAPLLHNPSIHRNSLAPFPFCPPCHAPCSPSPLCALVIPPPLPHPPAARPASF